MRYDVLREYAVRDGAELMRLNAYLSFDRQRAEEDEVYRRGQANYTDNLRDFGYKVMQKKVRRYDNGDDRPVTKADLDVEITVDMMRQCHNLDRVILATGNGDFVQLVSALQEMGKRVEILGFDNVSGDLRREGDQYVSGFLIPNLLPFRDRDKEKGEKTEKSTEDEEWGEIGSRVRGVCYSHTGCARSLLRAGRPTRATKTLPTAAPLCTTPLSPREPMPADCLAALPCSSSISHPAKSPRTLGRHTT
jgi:uncharacterized LabA/DUF88 family protein